MKTVIKSSEGLVREIEVELPIETVDAAFAEVYHKYCREANIPGFRPGKAPLSVIKARFREAIYDDVLEALIRKSYPEAIKEHKLDVISHPSIPKCELQEGTALKYTAKIEVMPHIENIAFDGLELPETQIEVTDTEVNSVFEYLRKKNSEVRPVDRPAIADDILTADLIKLEDSSEVLKGNEFKNNEIELSSPLTVKEFKEALLGIKAGEERETAVTYPSDYSDDRLAGKTIKYLCRVSAVKERILPPENDSFAKQVGGVETMLELRLKIREDLKVQKETDRDKWRRSEITRQMLQKNPIDIPEAMVRNYLDSVVKDYEKNYPKFDEKEVREKYRPVAMNWIGWNLLATRLAELQKIEVLPIDTENWIKRFAENYRMETDKAKEALGKSGRIQEIRETILEEKVFDFLFSKVTYKPVKADKPEEASAEDQEL
ncbi:MAG: trigger factor [candidate division Zixibacteria bacterium]|nr:trigger factor [candidate division Zixibacteria bacterium]